VTRHLSDTKLSAKIPDTPSFAKTLAKNAKYLYPSRCSFKLMRIRRPAAGGNERATAYGWPRDFLGNRFVYAVISQRAGGLSIGVNLNPEKYCNFQCVYCEVSHGEADQESRVDVNLMSEELTKLLDLAEDGKLREHPRFRKIPAELLALKEVALSGDGEPTLSPNFEAGVEAVLRVRSQRAHFFKVVLITNTAGLRLPQVERGCQQLTHDDEIWAKLDAGSQPYLEEVNRPGNVTLKDILANILYIGRLRPIVIQSLFPLLNGEGPSDDEIDRFVHRLQELKAGGAQIRMVQIYSAHRPAQNPNCGHLPLSRLSAIARQVRRQAGLPAEVF
jgi:wyosine [tRNA(Phe)-imidazoG37] synthetase (radical SAM superfamily)